MNKFDNRVNFQGRPTEKGDRPIVDWINVPAVPLSDVDLTREWAIWLAFPSGDVTVGRIVQNGPGSFKPHHWNTLLGIASSQSVLGEPVFWAPIERPDPPDCLQGEAIDPSLADDAYDTGREERP